jgi:hypothetical protein
LGETRNEQRVAQTGPISTLIAAESLRSADSANATAPVKGEERISLFWRIFGGTILSIVALVSVTLYQQLVGNLNELRNELNHINESRTELIKKEEMDTRLTRIWNTIRELQALEGTINAMKERSLVRDQQVKEEQQRAAMELKELQSLRETVTYLKERAMLHDQRMKEEDERKELVHELQNLRERLANLEGRQAKPTPIKNAFHKEED